MRIDKKGFRLTCFLVMAPLFLFSQSPDVPKHIVQDLRSSAMLMIRGESFLDVDPTQTPGRLYVKGNGKVQSGASVILRVTGVVPGSQVYWSYRFKADASNSQKSVLTAPFSSRPPYSFNRADYSSTADEQGVAQVLFRSTTYAGDRIQFGAGLKTASHMSQRFRLATLKSKSFHVWKRLHMEQPVVLKNVLFPSETWDLVRDNLASMNIELSGNLSPGTLNPTHPKTRNFFTGTGNDLRYGPHSTWDFGILLEHINLLSSDGKSETVNVVVLGALSKNHDLIKNILSSAPSPPQPVRYNYHYKRKELNPTEFFSYGTAIAIIGQSPAVFVWSDYWWMFSQRVKVPHAKTLARVLLHELGHHLLRNRGLHTKGVLDSYGHIIEALAFKRTIMNGCHLSVVKNGKGWDFSGISVSMERRFIKRPSWHYRVEQLIRQYYIPLSQ